VEYNNLLSLGKPFGISEGSDGDWSGSGNYDMRRVIAYIKQRWPRCVFFIQFDNDHVEPTLTALDGILPAISTAPRCLRTLGWSTRRFFQVRLAIQTNQAALTTAGDRLTGDVQITSLATTLNRTKNR
jgi:hypothetical protein